MRRTEPNALPEILRPAKLLIVDDEPDLRVVMKRLLEKAGYHIITAEDGKTGIKTALEEKPDLILLDINMPDMSGMEVCKRLKSHVMTKEIAIILFTALSDTHTKVSGLDVGADDYLVKSADMEEVKARVRTQLRLKRLRDELSLSNRQLATAQKRINSELAVARKVQQGIYPEKVDVPSDLQLAVHLVQAQQVGGDYYDVIRLSEHETALLMVDVSGHDVASAFIVGMAKIAFSVHLKEQLSLVDTLNRVNSDLMSAIKTGHHLTAFIAVVNCRERQLRYAKGGHFDQYLYKAANGEIQALSTQGMVVGCFEDGLFEEKKTQLEPGDKLVLYTDGLLENKNKAGEPFGKTRLLTLIRQFGQYNTSDFHQALIQHHREFLGEETQVDDTCLLVAGVPQVDSPAKVSFELDGSEKLPTYRLFPDKAAAKKGISDILTQLDNADYPDPLILHYRKALHLLVSAFYSAPKAYQSQLKVTANISENQFTILFAAEPVHDGPGFFVSDTAQNILLHFDSDFVVIDINESGTRLVFRCNKANLRRETQKEIEWKSAPEAEYLLVPPDVSPLLTVESIKHDLIKKKVLNGNFDLIKKALLGKEGKFVMVGPPFEYYDFQKNSYFELNVTAQEAVLQIKKLQPKDLCLTEKDILFLLEHHHVCHGLREEEIKSLVLQPTVNKVYQLAKASEPVEGKDAQLFQKVKIDPTLSPLERKDGTVDYKILDLIPAVEVGTVIMEKTPPTPGTAGRSVYGRSLDAMPGNDIALQAGENTAVTDGGTKLVARTSGYLYKNNQGIHVREVFYVKENVDYSTGNISYSGDVYINGNVLPGFSVRAGGNIWIGGNTEGSEIRANAGNIEFRGGVFGKGKTIIQSGGDVCAEFIQEAEIHCRKNLNVKKSLLRVRGEVQGDVNCSDPNLGAIIGGSLTCRGLIKTSQLGSEQEIKTIIQLMGRNDLAYKEKRASLNKQRSEAKTLLGKIKSQIQTKRQLFLTKSTHALADKQDLEKLIKAYYFTRDQVENLEKKIQSLADRSEGHHHFGRIIVTRQLYGQTFIVCHSTERKISNKRGPCQIHWNGEDIEIQSM